MPGEVLCFPQQTVFGRKFSDVTGTPHNLTNVGSNFTVTVRGNSVLTFPYPSEEGRNGVPVRADPIGDLATRTDVYRPYSGSANRRILRI
jgi:hypothetical protein